MASEPDFIVSELLSELKAENERKDNQVARLVKLIKIILVGALVTVFLVVAGFLWYLNQYDYVSTTTQSAEGVYAIVDSSGNIISQDLTAEQIETILRSVDNG